MSVASSIPTVWHAALLKALQTAHVYAQPAVINTDYEGDISQYGDTVRVNMIGDVTINDHTTNTDIPAPEELDTTAAAVVIDQAKNFNFAVDDVDRAQSRNGGELVSEAMARAAYKLRDARDRYVAGLYTDIAPTNWVGTDSSPKSISGSSAPADAYNYLVDLGVKLDESDTPSDGRFVVVPPWFDGVIRKDSRFVGSGADAADRRLANDQVGEAAGFTIYKSNNVPNVAGAKFKVIAGHRSAWTFAGQINKVELYRPEKRFADAVKGLDLYGAKVLRPQNLAVLVATAS